MTNLDSTKGVDFKKIDDFEKLISSMSETEIAISSTFLLSAFRKKEDEIPFLCWPDTVEVKYITPNHLCASFLMRVRLRADRKREVSVAMLRDIVTGFQRWEIYNISEPLLPNDYSHPVGFPIKESEKMVSVVVKMLNGELTKDFFETDIIETLV